jgi:hypothetical protein
MKTLSLTSHVQQHRHNVREGLLVGTYAIQLLYNRVTGKVKWRGDSAKSLVRHTDLPGK